MRILIDQSVTGLPYDIVLSEGLVKKFSDHDSYDFRFANAPGAFSDLLRIIGYEREDLFPRSYAESFRECHYTGPIPWSYVIPATEYKSTLKGFISDVQDYADKLEDCGYAEFFSETNEVFSLLKPCSIRVDLCRSLLDEFSNHTLESFLKMAKGSETLPIPRYCRASTKTGRLVIKEGPQILTLKKEFRKVLKPRNPLNKLYEIDFISLEPRVALNLAGVECSGDVYTSFAKSYDLNVSRDVSKLAVLCALYGAGKYRLESVLSNENSRVSATELLRMVKKYFRVKDLQESLESTAESGYIQNCFKRPVQVDDARPSVLLNNFLQSSATDVALAGFLDFCRLMNGSIRPLFIIHDALIFEADPKKIDHVTEYVDNGYVTQELGTFPLKITELSSDE